MGSRTVMGQADRVEYRVTAHNGATASENRLHVDEVARRYGFRGGLVPGVTLYSYVCHPLVGVLGVPWLTHGTARIRFLSPCYDGEELTVSVTGATSSVVDFEVRAGQRVCAAGSASLADIRPGGDEMDPVPAATLPSIDDRPVAGEDSLVVGAVLGSIHLPTDPESAVVYLAKVAEMAPVYPAHGIVHPGLLLEGANGVLMANFALPVWLHVDSGVRHLRSVSIGEDIEVRARIAEVFERKGHRFVRLDVVWMAGPQTVATGQHTAIWQLAGT